MGGSSAHNSETVLGLETQSDPCWMKTGREHGTHLTMDQFPIIQEDKTDYCAEKGGYSSKGINLLIY
jgi:hypothetical protein